MTANGRGEESRLESSLLGYTEKVGELHTKGESQRTGGCEMQPLDPLWVSPLGGGLGTESWTRVLESRAWAQVWPSTCLVLSFFLAKLLLSYRGEKFFSLPF